MFSPLRRGAGFQRLALALALAAWIVPGSSAFARGGHGGGGHGGGHGGHGGGHHSGGHHSGGFHYGRYHGVGSAYGGYRYPSYGYGYGYAYPYYNYGYAYPTYTYAYPGYVYSDPSPVAPAEGAAVDAALPQGRYLGIDERAVVDSSGQGMQVMRVYPGSPAEQAGLQMGDVIRSANGYVTEQHGNLAWIIANAAPNGVLQLNVRTARDGADHVISARVP